MAMFFESPEKLRLADHTAFQGLIKTRPKLSLRKGREQIRIDEHGPRLMKGADQVLAGPQIDTSLAADGRVNLGHNCGGDLDHINSAHVNRGEKPCDISDHASAQRNQHSVAIGTQSNQLFRQHLDSCHSLVTLAVWHFNHLHLPAVPGKRRGQFCAPLAPYWRSCHHKAGRSLWKKSSQTVSRVLN